MQVSSGLESMEDGKTFCKMRKYE